MCRFIKILCGFLLLLSMIGCLQSTDSYLYEYGDSELVVEGRISGSTPPYYVSISKSASPQSYENSTIVENLKVVIADDDGLSEQLKYEGDGIYSLNLLQGVEGKEYFLEFEYDGVRFEASDYMKAAPLIDSAVIRNSYGAQGQGNYLVLFGEKGTEIKYYYKVELTVNGVSKKGYYDLYLYEDFSVGDNQVFILPEKFIPGDSVYVEVHSITERMYEYFRGLNKQVNNLYGDVQAPAINPPTNISGALGYFMVSSVWGDTVIVE